MMIGTRLRELLAELAELREQTKTGMREIARLRREHHGIVDAARSQSRLIMTAARRLAAQFQRFLIYSLTLVGIGQRVQKEARSTRSRLIGSAARLSFPMNS